MAYANNIPVNPATRRRIEVAPGTYGQALPLHLAAPVLA